MGLVSWTVGLPLLPVRGVLALGRTIEQQVEQERGSTASVRRRLEAVEQTHAGDGDPRSARREAEQVEQILGELLPPAPVVSPEPAAAHPTDDAGARPNRAHDGDDG